MYALLPSAQHRQRWEQALQRLDPRRSAATNREGILLVTQSDTVGELGSEPNEDSPAAEVRQLMRPPPCFIGWLAAQHSTAERTLANLDG